MKRLVCVIVLLLISAPGLFAAGTFGMGIDAGVSGDGGTLGRVTRDINFQMRENGSSVTEIPAQYVPVVIINFTYSNQSVFIGLGWEYCSTLFMRPEGSVDGNSVTLDYTRFMFPMTIGYSIPLTRNAKFYFAGGFDLSTIIFQISQSNPGVLPGLNAGKLIYLDYVLGFHFKAGAEAVLSRNYSLVFEYTFFMGRSTKVKDEDNLSEIVIGGSDFEITAGFRYNLDLSF